MDTKIELKNGVWSQVAKRQVAVLSGLLLSIVTAQIQAAPGDLDLPFDLRSGLRGDVAKIACQSDGKILIGGSLTIIPGVLRSGIARTNADGSVDETHLSGMDGVINRERDLYIDSFSIGKLSWPYRIMPKQ